MNTGVKRLKELAKLAWKCRDYAYVVGNTKVGAAALSNDGVVSVGCNVEHRFRSHDVHAEINAITSMVAAGGQELAAIVIVAERDNLTPCGACMDWLFQLGGPKCIVAIQSRRLGSLNIFQAQDLMPHYPE